MKPSIFTLIGTIFLIKYLVGAQDVTSSQNNGVKSDFLIDLLCACRNFTTPQSNMSKYNHNDTCRYNGFDQRWKFAPGFPSEIISPNSGIVGKAFIGMQNSTKTMIIAFRHQEGETLFDEDMWEAMGLWGRNYVELSTGYGEPGSLLSWLSLMLQKTIYRVRKYLGRDYYTNGIIMTTKLIQSFAEKDAQIIFTGYSMGGAHAQLQALYFQKPAIVFASNGIRDIVHLVNDSLVTTTAKHISNIFHEDDAIPRMDCQIGRVHVFDLTPDDCDSEDDDELDCKIHEHYVYGKIGERNLARYGEALTMEGDRWSVQKCVCMFKCYGDGECIKPEDSYPLVD